MYYRVFQCNPPNRGLFQTARSISLENSADPKPRSDHTTFAYERLRYAVVPHI